MSTSQNQWSSPCQVLSIHPENENAVYQLFGNDVIFFAVACLSQRLYRLQPTL